MTDALLAPHVVKAGDAEALDEFAPGTLPARRQMIRRRHAVIEHHHNALRVTHALDVAPVARHEVVIEQDDGVQMHCHHVARHHGFAPALGGEYFFGDGHAHEVTSLKNHNINHGHHRQQ